VALAASRAYIALVQKFSALDHVRLGVIGCGNIAYWSHLRIAKGLEGASLVAASDPDAAARKRAGKLTGITPCEDTDELLARNDVDAVIISGPTHLHADMAIAACSAAKHVYVEKPLATSTVDGARVIEAAKRSGVRVMLGFNRRFHPAFEQARATILSGRLGRILAVQSSFCEPSAPGTMPEWKRRRETGGGSLLDLASHHIDLTRWFLSDEVSSVSAAISSDQSDQDSARVELDMENGGQVQGWFSFRSALSDWFEFAGELGTLRVDRHSPGLSLRVPRRMGYGVRSERIAPTSALLDWRMKRIVRPSAEPSYRRALAAFVGVLRGEVREVPGLDDGMRAIAVVEAAERAAAQGTRATVLPEIRNERVRPTETSAG
jgi:predicted dehydrogenase